MKGAVIFQKIWAGFDRLLLGAVFILLGTVWYSTERADAAAVAGTIRDRPAPGEAVSRRPPAKAVDGIRVSNGRTRMMTIARSMVDSGWERIPCSPAMDMREDGKTYEILFALPEGVARESVRVTTSGNLLTLAMKAEGSGQPYLKRVRLPCRLDQADRVQSAISNDVLRVRIQPSGG
jgi:HSP20 family molecular chaperone IbpA